MGSRGPVTHNLARSNRPLIESLLPFSLWLDLSYDRCLGNPILVSNSRQRKVTRTPRGEPAIAGRTGCLSFSWTFEPTKSHFGRGFDQVWCGFDQTWAGSTQCECASPKLNWVSANFGHVDQNQGCFGQVWGVCGQIWCAFDQVWGVFGAKIGRCRPKLGARSTKFGAALTKLETCRSQLGWFGHIWGAVDKLRTGLAKHSVFSTELGVHVRQNLAWMRPYLDQPFCARVGLVSNSCRMSRASVESQSDS